MVAPPYQAVTDRAGHVQPSDWAMTLFVTPPEERQQPAWSGPMTAPLARLKGEHRFQLLIKSRSRKQVREIADAALKTVVNLRSVNLEIDPVSIM